MVLNNANWPKAIYGFHQMLGVFLPIPDIEVSMGPGGQPVMGPKMRDGQPVLLAHITMEQATSLADAAYAVAVEYDLAKYFTGKTPALAALVITAGTIYLPKVMVAKAVIQAQRAANPQPATAAEMVNPTSPTEGNQGVYKYQ